MHGEKEFIMFPPEDHWKLQLFPYLHPRATKSQIPFVENFDINENIKENALVFNVEAGDVLYIPPLWFHQVKSIAPSISLSIWSPFYETDIANELLNLGIPVPFQFTQDEDTQKFAIINFLREILLLCGGNNENYPILFLKTLLTSRYGIILNSSNELFSTFECPTEPMRIKEIIEYYKEETQSDLHRSWLLIPWDRREIWLADYCEVIFLYLTKDPTQVPSAIQCAISIFISNI